MKGWKCSNRYEMTGRGNKLEGEDDWPNFRKASCTVEETIYLINLVQNNCRTEKHQNYTIFAQKMPGIHIWNVLYS